MRKISAEVLADSINSEGCRITTFVLLMPRFILAEINTHRAFSRSSASSRAIPAKKLIESVATDPFIPVFWGKEHSGMQAQEYFTAEEVDELALAGMWEEAAEAMIDMSELFMSEGVSKQITNRLLEPFLWHQVLVTATDFENFFSLRADNLAEPHLELLANMMLEAYNNSKPVFVKSGDWHVPYGANIVLNPDEKEKYKYMLEPYKFIDKRLEVRFNLSVASARCARMSYNQFDGTFSYEKDIDLFKRLTQVGHWSSAEHCARAEANKKYNGNFRGWTQLRKLFPDENRKDVRVQKWMVVNGTVLLG